MLSIITHQDNAVKNRCRSIEKNLVTERRSCSKINQQKIDIESVVYSHFGQKHCIYDQHDYRPVSKMVAPMDLHQHCDHEVEQASEDEFSVDCEENNPSTGTVIDNADAKIGWLEDDWVDDINQIAQLDIINEEKACDAMQASDEHDYSVDCEENNPSTGTINKAEAKIGWLEDDWWVDDINQIAQLDIRNEEKACDAMQASDEHDFSVDGEENNPSTGTIDKAEAKIGWLEDEWVDDVIQITHQLDIRYEEKACDAMMVTPSPHSNIYGG